MEEKYKNLFINELCKFHNYIIEELDDDYGNTKYVIRKNEKDYLKFIIFLDDIDDERFYTQNIINKYGNRNLKIIKVLFVESYNDTNSSGKDILIYDKSKNKVIYFDNFAENEANEIADIIYKHSGKAINKRKPVVTYTLIALNIIFFILSAVLSQSIFDININVLIFLGAKVNNLILNGEYYRFITCMFLHGGIIHIALNMYALYAIGPLIEISYGKLKYIIIYFVSGIISSIFSFLLSNSISIGASGAIFGLLGAALILSIKLKERGHDFKKNILSVIAINIVIGFTIPNIDMYGHLGGLIGGSIASAAAFLIKNKNK